VAVGLSALTKRGVFMFAAMTFLKYPASKLSKERDVPKSCVGYSGGKRAERQARPYATDFSRSSITIDICRLRGAFRLQRCMPARKLHGPRAAKRYEGTL